MKQWPNLPGRAKAKGGKKKTLLLLLLLQINSKRQTEPVLAKTGGLFTTVLIVGMLAVLVSFQKLTWCPKLKKSSL